MNSQVARIVTVVLALGLAQSVRGDLIPTPDFSDHAIPTSTMPAAHSAVWAVVDIVALAVALCLATYFALVSRSRKRLLMLTVGSLAYFGFVRRGCVCPIGSTQNIALAIANPQYIVPLTVIVFFALPLAFTLFFGRTFCAAVCPLGAVQELVSIRSFRVPRWLDQALGVLPYIYLGTAVILAATSTAFIICRFDPFVAMFRLSGSMPMLLFGGGVLLLATFVGRPYCRYACPYGAMLRVLSRLAKWHVRIPPTACINCRLCEDVCPYDAIQPPTVTPPADARSRSKARLIWILALAPLIVGISAAVGNLMGKPLARWSAEVRLAEQLRNEELGLAPQTTDATDAFRSAGRSPQEAYATAIELHQRFRLLGSLLGLWVGFVLAAKLVQLSLRRRRTEYQANRSGCVACGRCFWYCPVEQVRLGIIVDVAQVVPEVHK